MEYRNVKYANPQPCGCQSDSELGEIYKQCAPVPASGFRQVAPRNNLSKTMNMRVATTTKMLGRVMSQIPQRLKPHRFYNANGTSELVPFPGSRCPRCS